MTLNDMAFLFTCVSEAVICHLFCESFFERRDNFPKYVYFIGVLALVLLIWLSNQAFMYGGLNVIFMTLSYFAISFIYESKLGLRVIVSLASSAIMLLAEVIILFVITLIYGITVSDAVSTSQYQLLGIILSKMLGLIIAYIIRLKARNKLLYEQKRFWILLFIVLLTTLLTIFLIFRLAYDLKTAYMYNISILCSFGLMASTFFVLYLYERLSVQAYTIMNKEKQEQRLNEQLKHMDELITAQDKLKKFRHDYSNYIIGLKSYMENCDYEGARIYIDEMSQNSIHVCDSIDTGNTALDAVLNTKKAVAEAKGISFETKLEIPKQIFVTPMDICAVFGNALDNAIEACERTNNEDKKINIVIVYRDDKLFCKITNTCPNQSKGVFKTSKPDKENHGIGLKSIEAVLNKYDSVPVIEQNDVQFTLKFYISNTIDNNG